MIQDLEGQLIRLRNDLAHVDATLSEVADGARPPLTPSSLPRRRSGLFARKELPARIIAALRDAERDWESVEAIAARIVVDKGLDDLSGPAIRRKALATLRALQKRGVVANDKTSRRWALKP